MKRVIAYLIVTTFLLSQTEMHELLKLPSLFLHYFEHTQSEDLSFIDFLHNHYCEEHHQCAHENRHDLPFQCTDCTHFVVACVLYPNESFSLPVCEQVVEHGLARSEQFVSESFIDFWQPPKL